MPFYCLNILSTGQCSLAGISSPIEKMKFIARLKLLLNIHKFGLTLFYYPQYSNKPEGKNQQTTGQEKIG
jgi:hypothetical protein